MKFNSILKKLRTEKGISQRTLAKDIKVAPTAISCYEKGTKQPTLENVVKLAAYFGVSTDMLLGIDSTKEKSYTNLGQFVPLFLALVENYNFFLYFDERSMGGCVIETSDPRIQTFIYEWKKLFDLYENGTINKDLYDLWIKDKIESMSQMSAEIPQEHSVAQESAEFI